MTTDVLPITAPDEAMSVLVAFIQLLREKMGNSENVTLAFALIMLDLAHTHPEYTSALTYLIRQHPAGIPPFHFSPESFPIETEIRSGI